MGALRDYYLECHGKRKYKTRSKAVLACKRFARNNKDLVLPYQCFYCKQWHFGHPSKQKLEKVKAYYRRTRTKA